MKRILFYIFLLGGLLRIAAANEPASAPGFCEAIAGMIGGELVEWSGYPVGWDGLPQDPNPTVERVDFPADGGLWRVNYPSDPAHVYYFFFWSYAVRDDGNGHHYGSHDFCGPYRVEDEQ